MAPKKKLTQEWNECKICGRIVYKTDVETHTNDCTAIHGFIKHAVLHAFLLHTPVNLKQVPTYYKKENLLLLNPNTMKLCNLGVGQPCLVNNSCVLTSWPCSSIAATGVLCPSLLSRLETGSGTVTNVLVTVERFLPSTRQALRVEIELKESAHAMKIHNFLTILRCKMANQYIREGTTHAVRFFGQQITFHIRSIKHSKPADTMGVLAGSSPESQGLCDSLTSLDISKDYDSLQNLDTSVSCCSTHLQQNTNAMFCEMQQMSCVTSTPKNRDSVTSLSESPLHTPIKSEWRRPEQFFTPVIDTARLVKPNTDTDPTQFAKVTSETQFVQHEFPTEGGVLEPRKVTFDTIGGLKEQIAQIQNICIVPLKTLKTRKDLVIPLERGILLCGPPGTGKSMLVEALVNELEINTVHISPLNFYSQNTGEAGEKLQDACKRSPSIVVISRLEVLCPAPSSYRTDAEKQRVNLLCSFMDRLSRQTEQAAVVVVGITSRLEGVDPELLKQGRFSTKIDTTVPTAEERGQILQKLLQDVAHDLSDADIKSIADNTHAYVGDDLLGVVNRAKEISVSHAHESAVLSKADLKQASKSCRPSAMKEAEFELYVPQVRWSDVGGQESLKLKLRQMVEWPLQHGDVFRHFGLKMTGGLLMYGPPGCSKTLIAKALAGESRLNFFAVKGPELLSKYVGESERVMRELFRKARSAAPAIIFFDEIDSIAVERGVSSCDGSSSVCHGVLTQLLTEMDGFAEMENVIVIAATNRPDKIDLALLRPGRLSHVVYVPLPDVATRRAILEVITRKTPVASDVSIDELVERTERFSGAELTQLFHQAAYIAITESGIATRMVHQQHLEAALQRLKPQTTPEMIQFYENCYARLTSGL